MRWARRERSGDGDGRARSDRVDLSLTLLLGIQALTLFVVLPLGAGHPAARFLLDASHLLFAAVCIVALTRHPGVRAALVACLALLAIARAADGHVAALGGARSAGHDLIALAAFSFNLGITAIVARHIFSPGRVTRHRVRGAILLYLNMAALFAIAYGEIVAIWPGAIVAADGSPIASGAGMRTAAFTYFSLATITTAGYGDLVPVHPLARSLANLEAVFGQLFPATLLARLVALQLAHDQPPARAPQDCGDGR